MFRYVAILCGLMFVFAGCAAKSANQSNESNGDSLRQSLAGYKNACANIAFAQTKAKVAQADSYKSNGKAEEAKKADNEAVELFKTEQSNYQKLNDANDAQISRAKDIKSRMDSMEAEAKKADAQKWSDTKANVNNHLAKAQKAYENCDVDTAKSELDTAESLLNGFSKGSDEGVNQSNIVYTVKKGDCLWVISGHQYKNPFMWPLIYWANKKGIKDPDLIFPGQNFQIVMKFKDQDKNKAVNFSKTRGPWSLYDNK